MTREEYIKKSNNDEEWAPGWEAIENEFFRLYPDGKIDHYMTNLNSRAMFGGPEYLDGYDIYDSHKGYYHIVTYGMSELYVNPEALSWKYSKFGYEMTIKLKENSPNNCLWAMNMMSKLARYTYQQDRYFSKGDFVIGDGTPIHIGTDSKITGLIIVNDTSAKTLHTIHGEVEFLQLVGVTKQELDAIQTDISNFDKLLAIMKKDNPELVTDITRNSDYI